MAPPGAVTGRKCSQGLDRDVVHSEYVHQSRSAVPPEALPGTVVPPLVILGMVRSLQGAVVSPGVLSGQTAPPGPLPKSTATSRTLLVPAKLPGALPGASAPLGALPGDLPEAKAQLGVLLKVTSATRSSTRDGGAVRGPSNGGAPSGHPRDGWGPPRGGGTARRSPRSDSFPGVVAPPGTLPGVVAPKEAQPEAMAPPGVVPGRRRYQGPDQF
ncbi:small nuclear ribonucleoprotein-associated protein B'-like [Homarus americanus]|uniref:small nuclear ribonucleoprotein-associated protein B'-like n=1 Tax=Homarus americanus TaxID=6706 RepID=UPI001C462111|nr:small nuclear ribonucleoprotein-associated protein B'-like [Homarus americanus]